MSQAAPSAPNDSYDKATMIAELTQEEAKRYFVYDDATGLPIRAGSHVVGNPTIGIGRNLSGSGISSAEAEYLCGNDCDAKAASLDRTLPWWRSLLPARQRAMLDLEFNLGEGGLLGFPEFLHCMQAGDWQGAVTQLQESRWWHQVGQRGPMITARIIAG